MGVLRDAVIDFPADWPKGFRVNATMHAAPSMKQWTAAASSLLKQDRLYCSQHTASDCEASDALQLLFWGRMGGVALELGGLDGMRHSQTALLAEALGWRRIIIEASVGYRESRQKVRHPPIVIPPPLAQWVTAQHWRRTHRSLRTWSVSRLPCAPSRELSTTYHATSPVGSPSSCRPSCSVRS